jgi:hypothetical protein
MVSAPAAMAETRWLPAHARRDVPVARIASIRCAVSSERSRKAIWMADPAAVTAMINRDVDKYESVRLAAPTDASMSSRASLSPTKSSMLSANDP